MKKISFKAKAHCLNKLRDIWFEIIDFNKYDISTQKLINLLIKQETQYILEEADGTKFINNLNIESKDELVLFFETEWDDENNEFSYILTSVIN